MRASNLGERKLTELDFTRLTRLTRSFQPEAGGHYVT